MMLCSYQQPSQPAPPQQPPPPPQPPQQGAAQPAWKAAADRVAAAAAGSGPAAAASAVPYQQQGYSAVPPPASLSAGAAGVAAAGARRGFSIRPQLPKAKPQESFNPLVAAFNQAASKLAPGSGAVASAAPAYTRVQLGAGPAAAQQQQQQAVGPQQWPPALKSYVERAFKSCDVVSCRALHRPTCLSSPASPAHGEALSLKWLFSPLLLCSALQRQRPKLQEILKTVIAEAQSSGAPLCLTCWNPRDNCFSLAPCRLRASAERRCGSVPAGELWTRDWDAMPLPDLTQSAADAAAVLSEVAAVSGPAAARPAAGQPGHASRWQAAQQQYGQQKQQKQQAGRWAQRQRLAVDDDEWSSRRCALGVVLLHAPFASLCSRAEHRSLLPPFQFSRPAHVVCRGRKRSYQDDRSSASESGERLSACCTSLRCRFSLGVPRRLPCLLTFHAGVHVPAEDEQWSHVERQRRQRRAGRFADTR